jgi:hypothetical protein
MTDALKNKVDSIDKSKLNAKTKEVFETIVKGLRSKDKKVSDKSEELLDKLIKQGKDKNADIFVAEKTSKASTQGTASQVKSRRQDLFDAIQNDPKLSGFNKFQSVIEIDAERIALPRGKRVSKKGWKNQYGKSTGGRTYYETRENRMDRKAPIKRSTTAKPWLEYGGEIEEGKYVITVTDKNGVEKVANTKNSMDEAMAYATLKKNVIGRNGIVKVYNDEKECVYKSFYEDGGELSKKVVFSFSFNTDNISLKEVINLVKPYSKDWRTSGDISEVNFFITLKQADALNLRKELKSYGYFYDFEMENSRYEDGGYMAKGGRIQEEGDYLLGYEPYFEKNVWIAHIDRENKIVSPTSGYYPKHPMSKKAINWAKNNGYDYIADGKKYEEGGKLEEKVFSIYPHSVGKAKYVIDVYDGNATNKDGSPFIGIRTAQNKVKLNSTISSLKEDGFKEVDNVFNYLKTYEDGGSMTESGKYYVMDAKDGRIVSKGFDTEEEAKVEKFRIFEMTSNPFLTQKKMANGGYMAKGGKFEKPIPAILDDYGNIKSEKTLQQDLEYLKEAYENKQISKYEYDEEYNGIKEQIKFLQKYEDGGYMADGGVVDKMDFNVLNGLQGFNNGRNLNGLLESMHLSDYRFNKYADKDTVENVKESLKKLISMEFVEESGEGYKLTQKGANYRRENYNKYAKGGAIENQYEGRNAEDIWDSWTKEQKMHFLDDHNDEFQNVNRGEKRILSSLNFSDIEDDKIVKSLQIHLKQGQYAKGGKLTQGDINKEVNQNIEQYLKGLDKSEQLYVLREIFKEALVDANFGEFQDKVDQIFKGAKKFVLVSNAQETEQLLFDVGQQVARTCTWDRFKIKEAMQYTCSMNGYGMIASKISDIYSQNSKKLSYVAKNKVKYFLIKNEGKSKTFNTIYDIYESKDVLNGANVLENGGELSNYKYYPKSRVIIIGEDGKRIFDKVNGAWVKKSATPIGEIESTEILDVDSWDDFLAKNKKYPNKSLEVQGDDFSFLLKLSDSELSKRLDLIRQQKNINANQYLESKKNNENTKKIEEVGERLDIQERAIIEARLKNNSPAKKKVKRGMVVTKIADIPNFKQRLAEGKITYRGLGVGKLSDDFYNLAGENGTRIKVDGKEYYITDTEFDSFSRGSDGKLIIKFDAPYKKGYAEGGETEWFDYSNANLKKLPYGLDKYFIKTPNTKRLLMSTLQPTRARKEGVKNANKLMMDSYNGKVDRRKPISVKRVRGKYEIIDGNSTFANAKFSGWKFIYADVTKNPTSSKGDTIFEIAKKIRKENEPWKEAVKRANQMKKNG